MDLDCAKPPDSGNRQPPADLPAGYARKQPCIVRRLTPMEKMFMKQLYARVLKVRLKQLSRRPGRQGWTLQPSTSEATGGGLKPRSGKQQLPPRHSWLCSSK